MITLSKKWIGTPVAVAITYCVMVGCGRPSGENKRAHPAGNGNLSNKAVTSRPANTQKGKPVGATTRTSDADRDGWFSVDLQGKDLFMEGAIEAGTGVKVEPDYTIESGILILRFPERISEAYKQRYGFDPIKDAHVHFRLLPRSDGPELRAVNSLKKFGATAGPLSWLLEANLKNESIQRNGEHFHYNGKLTVSVTVGKSEPETVVFEIRAMITPEVPLDEDRMDPYPIRGVADVRVVKGDLPVKQ